MTRWRAWLTSLARWAWRRLARRPTRRTDPAALHRVAGGACRVLRAGPPPPAPPAGEAGLILAAHHARCRSAAAYASLAETAARRGVVIHARVQAGPECALFLAAAPRPEGRLPG